MFIFVSRLIFYPSMSFDLCTISHSPSELGNGSRCTTLYDCIFTIGSRHDSVPFCGPLPSRFHMSGTNLRYLEGRTLLRTVQKSFGCVVSLHWDFLVLRWFGHQNRGTVQKALAYLFARIDGSSADFRFYFNLFCLTHKRRIYLLFGGYTYLAHPCLGCEGGKRSRGPVMALGKERRRLGISRSVQYR